MNKKLTNDQKTKIIKNLIQIEKYYTDEDTAGELWIKYYDDELLAIETFQGKSIKPVNLYRYKPNKIIVELSYINGKKEVLKLGKNHE